MKLSERQSQVLRLIAKGKTNKEISDDLSIAQATVGHHVNFILSKLRAKSRAHAVFIFYVQKKQIA